MWGQRVGVEPARQRAEGVKPGFILCEQLAESLPKLLAGGSAERPMDPDTVRGVSHTLTVH